MWFLLFSPFCVLLRRVDGVVACLPARGSGEGRVRYRAVVRFLLSGRKSCVVHVPASRDRCFEPKYVWARRVRATSGWRGGLALAQRSSARARHCNLAPQRWFLEAQRYPGAPTIGREHRRLVSFAGRALLGVQANQARFWSPTSLHVSSLRPIRCKGIALQRLDCFLQQKSALRAHTRQDILAPSSPCRPPSSRATQERRPWMN